MTEEELIDCVASFVRGTLDKAEAERRFGEAEEASTVPREITLVPRDAGVADVTLELEEDRSISGIVIDLDEPIPVHFRELIAAYGEPKREPRLKVSEPILHKFVVTEPAPARILIGLDRPGGAEIEDVKLVIVRKGLS